MRLVKRVTGLLEIDPEMGKIWLNSMSGCALRVNNIEFENEEDKFSFIDIQGNKATFHKVSINSNDSKFEDFLNNFIDIILLEKENISIDDIEKIYEKCRKNLIDQINLLKGGNGGNIE